jgi:hypothetical protein
MKEKLLSTLQYIMKHELLAALTFMLISFVVYAAIDALPKPEGMHVEIVDLTEDFCSDHIGARLSVEGYLRPKNYTTGCGGTRGDMRCSIRLSTSSSGTGQSIPVSVEVGSRANQMEPLPSVYRISDLQFRDNARSLLGPFDRVRVTGKLRNRYCLISVRVIKAVP